MLDDRGLVCGKGKTIFCPPKYSDWLWGANTTLWSLGTSVLSLVKRLGREVDHLPVSSTTIRMNGAVPLLHLYNFKAWTGTT